MRTFILILILLIPCWGGFAQTAHIPKQTPLAQIDVGAYAAVIGGNLNCLAFGQEIDISFTFRNYGTEDQTNVKVYALVIGPNSQVVYSDSSQIDTLPVNKVRAVIFKKFRLEVRAKVDFYSYTAFPNDADRSNDTVTAKAKMVPQTDPLAVKVISPSEDTAIVYKSLFRPIGCFSNGGAIDVYNVPVRVQITKCSDQTVVYRADTTIEAMYEDSAAVTIPFPVKQGAYDVRTLEPGCYRTAVICKKNDDGDRTNDTAYSYFKVGINDNISCELAISPVNGLQLDNIAPVPVIFRFKNNGSNTEFGANLKVIIYDWNLKIIYQDSILKGGWIPGQALEANFSNFIPLSTGKYSFIASVSLNVDQLNTDNSIMGSFTIGKDCDASLTSLNTPKPDEVFLFNKGFKPSGTFRWKGISVEKINIPVNIEIRRCTDDLVVYSADTTIPKLSLDVGNTIFTFDDHTNNKSIRDLPEGCYKLTMRSTLYCDMDNSNNIQTDFFSISPNTAHDIAAIWINKPSNGERILYGTALRPIGLFKSVGASLLKENIPVSLRITRRSDMSLVFAIDTVIANQDVGTGNIQVIFPSAGTEGGFADLPPNAYKLSIISKLSDDINYTNDTVSINFSIVTDNSAVANGLFTFDNFSLSQNYPNPFSSSTTISYSLPERGRTSLRVMDVTGRVVKIHSVNELQEVGEHQIKLNTLDLPDGVYIYELTFVNDKGSTEKLSKRMTILNTSH